MAKAIATASAKTEELPGWDWPLGKDPYQEARAPPIASFGTTKTEERDALRAKALLGAEISNLQS